MIQETLSAIGLSEKEVRMYIALLRAGTQPTSFLARRAALNRGTAYVILHELLEKGLVSKLTRAKIQYWTPLYPHHLIHFVERRQHDLEEQKSILQSHMGELLGILNPHAAHPRIQFFTGVEGARTVLDDTLTSKDKTLRAFLSIADVAEFLGQQFFNKYTNRRITGGYTLHAIRTLEKDKVAFARDRYAKRYVTSKKERRIIRHVPEELAFPITVYIYDQKLAIISSKEENFALLIESKELASMQQKLFMLLWNSAAH